MGVNNLKNDGGPVFSQFDVVAGERDGHGDPIEAYLCASGGMTLRDWFAGQALHQAVEDYGQPEAMKTSGQRRDRGNPVLPYATSEMSRESIIARQAYRYADAMITARGAQ